MFVITREIGIDMGHRVTHHGSKCKNLHGHRYTVQVTAKSTELHDKGEQQGMTLDFGFLKEEMMDIIDAVHDHGMTLWINDPLLWLALLAKDDWNPSSLEAHVNAWGFAAIQTTYGKTCVVPFVPTAEELARFWFERLADRIATRSEGLAEISRVKVYETPNCSAEYAG